MGRVMVVTIRISEEMHTALRHAAVDYRTSLQGVCVQAFDQFLREHQKAGKAQKGAKR
jgi:hypothetical protein